MLHIVWRRPTEARCRAGRIQTLIVTVFRISCRRCCPGKLIALNILLARYYFWRPKHRQQCCLDALISHTRGFSLSTQTLSRFECLKRGSGLLSSSLGPSWTLQVQPKTKKNKPRNPTLAIAPLLPLDLPPSREFTHYVLVMPDKTVDVSTKDSQKLYPEHWRRR